MGFVFYAMIAGSLIGIVLFFKLPKLNKSEAKSPSSLIPVSVIIPARNEEKNLAGILSDLTKQTYKLHEVICVDDNSEDSTPEIIKRFGVKCLSLKSLEAGWRGKTWACQNGANAATGQLLIFVDADVRLSENAVELLVERYINTKKPISVQPYHTVKKQHEYFSLFFNLIPICATGVSLLGARKTTGFFGPVLLVSKETFDKYGGFERVRDSVVEDLYLGKHYNKNGVFGDLMLGGSEVSFRMYPNSIAEVFEGWSKNFSSASISIKWWMMILIAGWITFLTALPIEIAKTLIIGEYHTAIIFSGIYILTTAVIYRACRSIGSYPLYVCLIYPVYLLMFHVIFICSIIATFITKSTTWKGRRL